MHDPLGGMTPGVHPIVEKTSHILSDIITRRIVVGGCLTVSMTFEYLTLWLLEATKGIF